MASTFYLDILQLNQFATPPRLGRNKNRYKEFMSIKARGQQRRVVIDPCGNVLRSDLALYEALIQAGNTWIAVVVVVGQAKPADIKRAKAFSAKHPLPIGWGSEGEAEEHLARLAL
jgi:hypothetical protein